MKLANQIYDIMIFEDDRDIEKQEFLIFGEYDGFLDIVEANNMSHVMQAKPQEISTIYNLFRTSRVKEYEVCLCNKAGINFVQLKKNKEKQKFELVFSKKDNFFKGECVKRCMEYSPDKFVVCVDKKDEFYIFDRSSDQSIRKVKFPRSESFQKPLKYNFEILKVPGFDSKKFPFLLIRDSFAIYIFDVKSKRLYNIKSASYQSDQGYFTMDLLTQPNSPSQFSAIYFEKEESDEFETTTTTINRITFTEDFISVLKKIASGNI